MPRPCAPAMSRAGPGVAALAADLSGSQGPREAHAAGAASRPRSLQRLQCPRSSACRPPAPLLLLAGLLQCCRRKRAFSEAGAPPSRAVCWASDSCPHPLPQPPPEPPPPLYLQRDPARRITPAQILQHPWMQAQAAPDLPIDQVCICVGVGRWVGGRCLRLEPGRGCFLPCLPSFAFWGHRQAGVQRWGLRGSTAGKSAASFGPCQPRPLRERSVLRASPQRVWAAWACILCPYACAGARANAGRVCPRLAGRIAGPLAEQPCRAFQPLPSLPPCSPSLQVVAGRLARLSVKTKVHRAAMVGPACSVALGA